MKLTDIKRQQVLCAAAEEFRENGFAGTSMDNVATRAQVSKRTVYNHFANKDALFDGILLHMSHLLNETHIQPYDANRPLQAQLIDISRQFIKLVTSEEYISLSRVILAEAIHNPDLLADSKKLLETSKTELDLIAWFEDAIKDGKLDANTVSASCPQLVPILKAFCFWPRLFTEAPPLTDDEISAITQQCVGMFLGYYGK